MNPLGVVPLFFFGILPLSAAEDTGTYFSMYSGPGFSVVDATVGNKLRQEAFEDAILKSSVVYAGEVAGQSEDHLAQFELLKFMSRTRKDRVIVGFEMLSATLQPVLDAYAAGTLTEDEFLDQTNWKKEWGYDFELYKPVFDFVRERRLKAVALNLPRGVIAKLARGAADSLSAEEKALLPAKISVSRDKAYLAYLKKVYLASPASKTMTWTDYLLSVSAGNEAMGARIGDSLKKNPGYSFLALAGNGRIIYNAGLPASVKARTRGLIHASIYTMDGAGLKDFLKHPVPFADYVWFLKRPKENAPDEFKTRK